MTWNRPVQSLAGTGALTLAFGAWVTTGLGGDLTTRAVSDSTYSYLTDVRSFSTGGVIDAGWFAGYLAIAVGAMCARSNAGAPLTASSSSRPTRAGILAPFLAIFGALSLLAVRIETGHRLDNVSLDIAFAVVGLVLVRQALLVIDRLGPVHVDRGLPLVQSR